MLLMLTALTAQAQTFADIDWAQFARDSVMPRYSCSVELGEDYALYDYTASIEYPEFVPMSKEEIKRYRLDTLADSLPSWPENKVQQVLKVLKVLRVQAVVEAFLQQSIRQLVQPLLLMMIHSLRAILGVPTLL